MKNVFVDKNYDIVKRETSVYKDDVDRKIDMVFDAVKSGYISEREGMELLKLFLSKELEKDVRFLASATLSSHKHSRSPFLFMLNHSSFTKRYAS